MRSPTRRASLAGLLLAAFLCLPWAGRAEAFCTVAGGCQPLAEGALRVTFVGPDGQPQAAKLTVYPKGAPPTPEHAVAAGTTGKPIVMVTGPYDVKVEGRPTLWARGVAVEKDKTTNLEMGGFGKLLVSGIDVNGKPVAKSVLAYVAGADRSMTANIVTGKTNKALQIVAGTYDVLAKVKPDVWFEGIEIAPGETRELKLAAPTTLVIAVHDVAGKPLNANIWLYAPGDRKKALASARTNKALQLSPGTYDIRVALKPNVWLESTQIKPNQVTKMELPRRGAILVKLQGAMDKGTSKNLWVHLPGAKESVSYGNVGKPVAVGPGDYEIRMKIRGKWTRSPVTVEPGKTVEIEVGAT